MIKLNVKDLDESVLGHIIRQDVEKPFDVQIREKLYVGQKTVEEVELSEEEAHALLEAFGRFNRVGRSPAPEGEEEDQFLESAQYIEDTLSDLLTDHYNRS